MAKPASNSSTIAPAMVSSLFATARRSTGVYKRCKARTTRVSVSLTCSGNKIALIAGVTVKVASSPPARA